ncbi:MAG: hypothetical protein COA47_09795 [Robiginitomaculum sp.]|nr:MAG: hypothetical protein COA47_09795 [Robiginitomaculum sp.]
MRLSIDIIFYTVDCTINCIYRSPMTSNTYTDTHPLRGAFVANLLSRLADVIVEQGEQLLLDAGLEFPSRSVSSVLIIGERGKISAADIAKSLNQPHQLVTQRIELLLEMKIVKRIADPKDGRRKTLTLTAKGKKQFKQLRTCLAMADRAFSALFDEIGCDLTLVAERAIDALADNSILNRVEAVETQNLAHSKSN